jgi:hypothetical protein
MVMKCCTAASPAPSLQLQSGTSSKSLIRARDKKWRDQLSKLLVGHKGPLASLIEWLDQWMESDPNRSTSRFEALNNLVKELKKARASERAELMEAFLDDSDFASSPFHEGACEAFNEWRQTLPTA